VKPIALLLLVVACVIFVAAAACAKSWALAPGAPRLVLTLVLYTGGNLLMLFLIRQIGMATAFSLSAVLQLIAVNAVAILFFGESVGWVAGMGIVLAIVAVALITLGPRFAS
jgi:multidrug transporter EmrE-like cation transporter